MKTNKTKYGDVTKQLFEFVKENEPVSYTEMNKFYQMKIVGKKTYDPVNDRGGSFCHHLVSMKNKSRRNYSGRVEYIKKKLGGNRGKYYAYTLQGDRETLSTFCMPTKRYLVKTDIETYNEEAKQKSSPIKSDLANPSVTKVRLETIISDLTRLIERLEKDSLKKKYYNFKDPIAEYQKDDKIIQGLFRQRSLYGEALNGYTAYQQAIKKAQSFENTATGFLTK